MQGNHARALYSFHTIEAWNYNHSFFFGSQQCRSGHVGCSAIADQRGLISHIKRPRELEIHLIGKNCWSGSPIWFDSSIAEGLKFDRPDVDS